MIAADGAQSRVRRAMGVEMLGQRDVYDSVNILINADLRPWTDASAGSAVLRRES
jgi:2-polyprenyl-6-methoxyphenol hydroxylase-like FAD-dependent oxidoreductase